MWISLSIGDGMNNMIFYLYALYLAQSLKKRSKKFSHDDKDTLIIAHRGLRTKHLENTLEALNEAFLVGADGVEFDVQLSMDMVPMVFHDRSLMRLTGVENNIDHVSLSELSKLRQVHENYQSHYRIARLDEVLSAMPAGKLINIELKETTRMKGHKGMKQVLDCIAPHKTRLNIVISSFDPRILEWVYKLDGDYVLGLLLDKKVHLSSLFATRAIIDKIDLLHPHVSLLSPMKSTKIKKMGIPLILWGHKKLGEEQIIFHDHHVALISDICTELIETYRR